MKSIPFRIPKKDYEEIKTMANGLNISLSSAYQLWKRKMSDNKKWVEY